MHENMEKWTGNWGEVGFIRIIGLRTPDLHLQAQ